MRNVNVTLGTFARSGIEAFLGSDIQAGARAALDDLIRRLEAGAPPIAIPRSSERPDGDPIVALTLTVGERDWQLLEREAAGQGATVSELAHHSVLLYLAEVDRLAPPGR